MHIFALAFFGGIMGKEFELAFVSEDNLSRHLEYLNELKLKYSVFSKSYPELASADIGSIKRARIDKALKAQTVDLISAIKSHECYFSSFCLSPKAYKPIRRYFSSEDGFVYEIFLIARSSKSDFVYVFLDANGAPVISDCYHENPVFAIDIAEHAYFLDYGFSRDEYLRRALGYLNLEKLSLKPLDNTV